MSTALLFPGQGSQRVGMGRALADASAAARAAFAEADEALGFAISTLCFEGPEDRLMLTQYTQPAILTTSIAVLRALEDEAGLRFDAVAGHSLGEISALVAAGGLTLADAVRLVHLRGKAMQEAVPAGQGAMAAIMGMKPAALTLLCEQAAQGETCAPANLNGGGQVVISGHAGAVERAVALAKEQGIRRATLLKVSAPFHCALMQPAADRLAEALEDVHIGTLRVPVVANVDAVPNQDPARVKDLLVKQVTAPVRWEESVETLAGMGITRAVELGAGSVLRGLVRRIRKEIDVVSISEPDDVKGWSN